MNDKWTNDESGLSTCAAREGDVIATMVKKLHQEGKLSLLVDKDLIGNFDRTKMEEIVQIALLCTRCNHVHCPRMSEVLRLLEGDDLVDKWEGGLTND
ncbi:hypothetical protein GQ457_03G008250 [Hibiscus cannabinus]